MEHLVKYLIMRLGVKDVPPKHDYVVVGRKSRQYSIQIRSSDQELKVVLEYTDALISTLTREFENGEMRQSTSDSRDGVCDGGKTLHNQTHLLAFALKLTPAVGTAV
jgi:hypothetical protein